LSDFFVYCGLAGDTDPGRFWSAGLYRSRNGDGAWESIGDRLGTEPHVFSILADSRCHDQVTVGTHDGNWRSDDAGDSWRRLDAPKTGAGSVVTRLSPRRAPHIVRRLRALRHPSKHGRRQILDCPSGPCAISGRIGSR
jgi:hypothetical protein